MWFPHGLLKISDSDHNVSITENNNINKNKKNQFKRFAKKKKAICLNI